MTNARIGRRSALEVFALEPRAAQVVVRAADGRHAVTAHAADGQRVVVEVEVHGGIGAAAIDGLTPDTSYTLTSAGEPAAQPLPKMRTLAEPPGRYVGRFATISDLHVGETGFGYGPRLRLSDDIARAHPVVCLEAAIREVESWGAEALVVKGDIAHDSRQHEYDIAGPILRRFPGPTHVIPGNHDGGNHHHVDLGPAMALHGLPVHDTTTELRLGGLAVFLVNTVRSGHEHGYAPDADDPLFALVGAHDAALVVVHHHLMPRRIPHHPPLGVFPPGSTGFLDRLAAANPATWVTNGHTHRHRRHLHRSVVLTEVGSIKDHPGTWAGYLVYEGGLIQTVRRIAAPDALAWTERTRRMALGLWGRWSPGKLTDRSFTHRWPGR